MGALQSKARLCPIDDSVIFTFADFAANASFATGRFATSLPALPITGYSVLLKIKITILIGFAGPGITSVKFSSWPGLPAYGTEYFLSRTDATTAGSSAQSFPQFVYTDSGTPAPTFNLITTGAFLNVMNVGSLRVDTTQGYYI